MATKKLRNNKSRKSSKSRKSIKNKSRNRKIKRGGANTRTIIDDPNPINKINYIKGLLTQKNNQKNNPFIGKLLSEYDEISYNLENGINPTDEDWYTKLLRISAMFKIKFTEIMKNKNKPEAILNLLNEHISFLIKSTPDDIDRLLNDMYEPNPKSRNSGLFSSGLSSAVSGLSSGLSTAVSGLSSGLSAVSSSVYPTSEKPKKNETPND